MKPTLGSENVWIERTFIYSTEGWIIGIIRIYESQGLEIQNHMILIPFNIYFLKIDNKIVYKKTLQRNLKQLLTLRVTEKKFAETTV